MGDIVKTDDNRPPPLPMETWTQSRLRKAREQYEQNKIERQDRAEEADLKKLENENRKRELDLDSFEWNCKVRKIEDTFEFAKRAQEGYANIKDEDDLADEFGSFASLTARLYRKIAESLASL